MKEGGKIAVDCGPQSQPARSARIIFLFNGTRIMQIFLIFGKYGMLHRLISFFDSLSMTRSHCYVKIFSIGFFYGQFIECTSSLDIIYSRY